MKNKRKAFTGSSYQKEDKVVSATKSEEANKTKETAPVKLHHNLPRKKKVQTKKRNCCCRS